MQNRNAVLIYKPDIECGKEIDQLIKSQFSSKKELGRTTLSISNLADGGEIYRIFGDSVCSHYKLSPYPRVLSMNDFEVEKQSSEFFCKKWIVDLSKIAL